VLWLLPDRPRDARWLPAVERAWLEERLAAEGHDRIAHHGESLAGRSAIRWCGGSA
jgi:hypothetical protein